MTAAEKIEFKRRAQSVLRASIPSSVREGSANLAVQYREDAAVVAAFVQRGVQADRAKLACLRLEGIQGLAQVFRVAS